MKRKKRKPKNPVNMAFDEFESILEDFEWAVAEHRTTCDKCVDDMDGHKMAKARNRLNNQRRRINTFVRNLIRKVYGKQPPIT